MINFKNKKDKRKKFFLIFVIIGLLSGLIVIFQFPFGILLGPLYLIPLVIFFAFIFVVGIVGLVIPFWYATKRIKIKTIKNNVTFILLLVLGIILLIVLQLWLKILL